MSTQTNEDPKRSNWFAGLFRLALPTASVVLAFLYIENTFGRIRTSNLYYPYFVIGVMVLLIVTVYIEEFRKLRSRQDNLDIVESFRTTFVEWRRSVGFTILAVIYLWAIDVLGFFVATVIGMVSIMVVGGRRDPITIVVATGVLLVFVYFMFIELMGIRPPEGYFGL